MPPSRPKPKRERHAAPARLLAAIAAGLALLTILGFLALRPTGEYPRAEDVEAFGSLFRAEVLGVSEQPCLEGDPESGACTFAEVLVLEGPDAGESVSFNAPAEDDSGALDAGDRIVVSYFDTPQAIEAGVQYQYAGRDRQSALLWLGLLFAVAVVALGRLRGLAALAGLAASMAVLLAFVLPSILEGRSPVLVAVVGAAAIAYVSLYSAHGFSAKTTVALLGTVASLALTVVLGSVFNAFAQISGALSEEATLLSFSTGPIDFSGIVLAGLVIGALGAIDDITVTQASAIWELRAADPSMDRSALRKAGMRIGRDHVSSTVNTLVLAYAGASMTLVLLFVMSGRALGQVANFESVAIEIIRTLVGSIGLVASVPITTWLATVAVGAGGGGDRSRRRVRLG